MSGSPSPAHPAPAPVIDVDALVCGGGLVGLTVGTLLATGGLTVAVVDREDPPTTVAEPFDGRASAIAAGSQRILAGAGVWSALDPEEACAILEIRVVDEDSPLFLHYDHRALGPQAGPLGYIVENRAMRRALLRRASALAPALRHLAPDAVTHLERGPAGVSARLASGGTVTARVAVAADGRLSPLREAAGIGTASWGYPQTALVATVRHERPHRGIAIERFLPAGPFAILPMTGERASIVWTERSRVAGAFRTADDATFKAALARRFGDFLGAVEPIGPRWSYPLSFMIAKRFVADRLALVGDAAHVIHPIAGQGFNLGLRDAAALAEALVDAARLGLDIGAPGVLQTYERRRRVDTLALGAVTDGLNRLFSTDLAPVQAARRLGLAAVHRLPPLKRLLMRHAMGLVGDLPRLTRGEPL